jgi:predicted transcriptional regulator
MALTISPELEGRIQRVVDSGRYATPEQAIESAVSRIESDEMLAGWSKADLEAAIDEGLASAERGELYTEAETRAYLAKVRSDLER